jgi:hypothetical protein
MSAQRGELDLERQADVDVEVGPLLGHAGDEDVTRPVGVAAFSLELAPDVETPGGRPGRLESRGGYRAVVGMVEARAHPE